jgi:hypothetical protein
LRKSGINNRASRSILRTRFVGNRPAVPECLYRRCLVVLGFSLFRAGAVFNQVAVAGASAAAAHAVEAARAAVARVLPDPAEAPA